MTKPDGEPRYDYCAEHGGPWPVIDGRTICCRAAAAEHERDEWRDQAEDDQADARREREARRVVDAVLRDALARAEAAAKRAKRAVRWAWRWRRWAHAAQELGLDTAYEDAEDVLQRFLSKQDHRAMTAYDALELCIEEIRLRARRRSR